MKRVWGDSQIVREERKVVCLAVPKFNMFHNLNKAASVRRGHGSAIQEIYINLENGSLNMYTYKFYECYRRKYCQKYTQIITLTLWICKDIDAEILMIKY